MRAVVLEKTGDIDELVVRDVPDPTCTEHDVLVRVRAAGVCGRDLIDRRGGFPAMKLPTILGHEFGGEVVGIGSAVTRFRVGDRVVNLHRPHCGECPACLEGIPLDCERSWQSFGHTVDGAYAELCVAHERALVQLPEDLEFVGSAALGCTAGVALRALRGVAKLELGERVLITGASGGVGMAAIQLAKSMGASVVAQTSSAAKREFLLAAGADEVVVGEGPFRELRVDVALELTGAATFTASLKSLRPRGRIVVIGNITLERVNVNLGAVILYSHCILGSRSYSAKDLEDVFALVRTGKLLNLVDRTLALDQAREAHRLLETRAVKGRVILVP